jgi:hypothetical protein
MYICIYIYICLYESKHYFIRHHTTVLAGEYSTSYFMETTKQMALSCGASKCYSTVATID